MHTQIVNTVFSIDGDKDGHIASGAGQATVTDMLKHFPLIHRGKVSIVVLRGFMIGDKFSPFNPELYAKRFHR